MNEISVNNPGQEVAQRQQFRGALLVLAATSTRQWWRRTCNKASTGVLLI